MLAWSAFLAKVEIREARLLGGGHQRGWVGFWLQFCGGFKSRWVWFDFGSWFGFGILGLDLVGVGLWFDLQCEGGHQAALWKKMMTGTEVMSVSCGFWFGVIGLLVAAMVEVFIIFFSCCGLWWWVDVGWMWMCRFLSVVIFFC